MLQRIPDVLGGWSVAAYINGDPEQDFWPAPHNARGEVDSKAPMQPFCTSRLQNDHGLIFLGSMAATGWRRELGKKVLIRSCS
jgi:hypothetical protein